MYPQREGRPSGRCIGQWNNHPSNYTELLFRPVCLMVSHCSNINVEGVLRSRSGPWAGCIYLPGRATRTPDVYRLAAKSMSQLDMARGPWHIIRYQSELPLSINRREIDDAYSSPLLRRNVARHISAHTITMPRKRQRPDNDEVIQDSSEGLRLTRSRACKFSCFPGSTFQCSKLTDNRHRV